MQKLPIPTRLTGTTAVKEDWIMDATKTLDQPLARLTDWLQSHRVEYEIHEHEAAFTASATAAAEGVDPRTFAKVVGLAADDGRRVLAILDATDRLDMGKVRHTLGAGDVRLLTEEELTILAPGCEAGAIPAVGALFGLATYADRAVREDEEISFNAGSHRFSARVQRAAWEGATDVVYADLARARQGEPAWAQT